MDNYLTTSKGVHIGRLYVNRTKCRPIEDADMRLLQLALIKTEANKFYIKHTKQFAWAGRASVVLLFALILAAKFAVAKAMS